MRRNFGDRDMQKSMKNDPTLRWSPDFTRKTRALGKEDQIIQRVGIGILLALESAYNEYKSKPNEKTAKKYCIWRLRFHKKLKNDRELLESINQIRGLGLHDSSPGKTCWDLDYS